MLGSTYYHSLTRKYITMFGNLFNDIKIKRFDKDNNEVQVIPVPIKYGPMQKWVSLRNENVLDKKVAIQLPRIAFQIQSLSFDDSRKISPNRSLSYTQTQNTSSDFFVPVPYKMNIDLYIITKNNDDMCQIFEQIAPYFQPVHTNTIFPFEKNVAPLDITIRHTGTSMEDSYEGDFLTLRYIVWTLNFELDIFYYGPKQTKGRIKRVIVDFMSDIDLSKGRDERVDIRPGLTVDRKPTSDPNQSIDYNDIEPDDDYGFIIEETTFQDGKKYNPKKGIDE